MEKNQKPGLFAVILSAPFVIAVLTLLVWPLIILAQRSLQAEGGEGFSMALYAEVLSSSTYVRAFINTAIISALSTVLALLICIPSAIYIEGKSGRSRKLLAVALTIPLSLPGIVIGFFVILSFGFTGVVPQLIEKATGQRQLTFAYTFWGLLLGYLYFQIPRVILVIRGAISGISQDAIDVARTLGASTLRVYIEVILPALRLAIISASSLSLATGFGAFGTAATLSRGYRVVPLEIAAAFTENFKPALAGAMSLLLTLITTAILFGVGSLSESRAKVQRRAVTGGEGG
ncbi:MAG: ABC transporter permease [Anaerolineales bacterium]